MHQVGLAAIGASVALVLVVGVAVVVQGPLSRVPENWLKFAVGLLLSSFGTFWAAEGAGAAWPRQDVSILGLLAAYIVISYGLVRVLQRRRQTMLQAAA
jgi:uncharacterized membrane protein